MKRALVLLVSAAVLAGCPEGDSSPPDSGAAGGGGGGGRGGGGPPADAALPAACGRDDDCRLFDDYCTGCDCRALGKAAPNPTCGGPGVQCTKRPCGQAVAACEAGRCVVRE